jgi:hypothetical protein
MCEELLREYNEGLHLFWQQYTGAVTHAVTHHRAVVDRYLRSMPQVQDVMRTHRPMPPPPPLVDDVPLPRALPVSAHGEVIGARVDDVDERILPQGHYSNYLITLSGDEDRAVPAPVHFPIERFMAHRDIVYYIVYQREAGLLSGHLHWHAYVEFKMPVPATWVRTTFFGDIVDLWIRPARNRYAARKYVMKPATRVPGTLHEWGMFRNPALRGSGIRPIHVST